VATVLRNVFTKTLWDSRRSLLGWVLAINAVAAVYAAFWPTVNTPQLRQALQRYPRGVLEAMNYHDLTSPAGYLGSSVFGLLVPVLVAVLAIARGTGAVPARRRRGGSSCSSPSRSTVPEWPCSGSPPSRPRWGWSARCCGW
jgi:ABC-2 type transport system permease protein